MLWTAKLRGYDEGNIVASRAKRFGLTIHYYPINFYEQENTFYFIATGVAKGSQASVRRCFAELKALRRSGNERYVVTWESSNEVFLSITAQPVSVESRTMVRTFYNPCVVHCKPAVIQPSGHEEWEVCAFNKADLDRLISVGEALYNLELISLKRATVSSVLVMSAGPRLSVCQRRAMEAAVRNGYYKYPRKTELARLAKGAGLATSTFHAHVRKAENKLIPHLFSLS